jgi:hypothetical protein
MASNGVEANSSTYDASSISLDDNLHLCMNIREISLCESEILSCKAIKTKTQHSVAKTSLEMSGHAYAGSHGKQAGNFFIFLKNHFAKIYDGSKILHF